MAEIDSIGIIELTSVGNGYLVEDAMLKAAQVDLVLARTLCPGKFMVVVSGDVASVLASVAAGAGLGQAGLVGQRVITKVHPAVFPALGLSVQVPAATPGALGVIETFSAASVIAAADAAAKAADVLVFRVHVAMALGGKGVLMLCGDVADVQAAVEAGSRSAGEEGMLVSRAVVAAPDARMFKDFS